MAHEIFSREKRELRRELLSFIKYLQKKNAREISAWNKTISCMRRRGALIESIQSPQN